MRRSDRSPLTHSDNRPTITHRRLTRPPLGGARCPPSTESPMAGPKLDGAGTEKMKTLDESLIRLHRLHGLVETYALAIKRSQPPATYLMPIRRALPTLASLLKGQFGMISDQAMSLNIGRVARVERAGTCAHASRGDRCAAPGARRGDRACEGEPRRGEGRQDARQRRPTDRVPAA